MTRIHGHDPSATDHRGLGVLDYEDSLRRIASTPIGRIAFQDAGESVILPVNHVVDGAVIAFRARWDSTLVAAIADESVAFEVDEYDALERTGWSVLVRGIATTVYDDVTSQRLEGLLGVPWEGRRRRSTGPASARRRSADASWAPVVGSVAAVEPLHGRGWRAAALARAGGQTPEERRTMRRSGARGA